VQWGITEIVAALKHKKIIRNKQPVDAETKKTVTKNVKAMFMHKIGGVLVNTADSIIISAFIGIIALGGYTNYTTIMVAMTSLLNLCFSPLTSVIGHVFVQEDKSTARKYHSFFHTFNFVLGVVFFLGYYAVIDNLVVIFYGSTDLVLSRPVAFVITLNYFIQFMRQSTLLFRDATGTFYHDRWKPLFEGLLNIGLSIGFVFLFKYLWGESFAVVGVIAATIITNIFICHVVEPHVLHKYALETDTRNYYIKNYSYIAIFTAALVALHFCHVGTSSQWTELLANGFIAIAVAIVPCAAAALFNKNFRHYIVEFINKFRRHKKNRAVAAEAVGNAINEQNIENANLQSDVDVAIGLEGTEGEPPVPEEEPNIEKHNDTDVGETD
ncbi:MAG: hypothetical protein K2M48_06310, partial [Clostridiales bacterium]|nr:hypothetical protein [Clostridiales bacterium]